MFAIYFPQKTGCNVQHFHDAGLADLLDDVVPAFTDFQPGPDGLQGIAASWAGRPITCGEFEWTKCRGGKFWLGKLANEKPKPEWFARADVQLGADVTFADGQEWHVPIARQLPQLLGLDDAGNLTKKLLPQYQRFWDEAFKTLKWFESNESRVMHYDQREMFDFVSLALSINYRLNPDVASWLGLIRNDVGWSVAGVVTEWEGLERAQKKTESAGSPTSAGGAA